MFYLCFQTMSLCIMGLNRLTALNSLSKSLKKSGKLFKKIKVRACQEVSAYLHFFPFFVQCCPVPFTIACCAAWGTTISQRSSINV